MEGQPVKRRFNLSIISLFGILLLSLLIPRLINGMTPPPKVIAYSEFKTALIRRAGPQRHRKRNWYHWQHARWYLLYDSASG